MTDQLINDDFVPSTEDASIRIRDKRKRDLIVVSKNGEVALARYPDLEEKEIKTILDMYYDLCEDQEEVDRMGKFLRYDDEEDEFCS